MEVMSQSRLEDLSIGTSRADWAPASGIDNGFATGLQMYGVSDFNYIDHVHGRHNLIHVDSQNQGNNNIFVNCDFQGHDSPTQAEIGIARPVGQPSAGVLAFNPVVESLQIGIVGRY